MVLSILRDLRAFRVNHSDGFDAATHTPRCMNRLQELFAEPPEPERSDDDCEIETAHDTFAVTRETAAGIARERERAHRLEARADRRPWEDDRHASQCSPIPDLHLNVRR